MQASGLLSNKKRDKQPEHTIHPRSSVPEEIRPAQQEGSNGRRSLLLLGARETKKNKSRKAKVLHTKMKHEDSRGRPENPPLGPPPLVFGRLQNPLLFLARKPSSSLLLYRQKLQRYYPCCLRCVVCRFSLSSLIDM